MQCPAFCFDNHNAQGWEWKISIFTEKTVASFAIPESLSYKAL